jgi:hypothetical protein
MILLSRVRITPSWIGGPSTVTSLPHAERVAGGLWIDFGPENATSFSVGSLP